MRHDPIGSGKRKPVNLSIDTGVVEAARAAGLNLSQISEVALREAAQKDHDRRWKEDNCEWIAAHQRWVAENELPLERYRLF
jgi:antitoxin CcdA